MVRKSMSKAAPVSMDWSIASRVRRGRPDVRLEKRVEGNVGVRRQAEMLLAAVVPQELVKRQIAIPQAQSGALDYEVETFAADA